ncbi:hypothetical protein [Bythopirellula polymerisocia]|uniref:Uncharacterized protein n=1 Tax=Bythopirellula polymerisocia TaxID=2528003 RepID=A0A5C6D334_9BACT|nr:hypothetical protein [Bythopirellula polymerisocia]TWU30535.1 hypothetical protein Pla144_13230 [Bythopirellula polymerisocia]
MGHKPLIPTPVAKQFYAGHEKHSPTLRMFLRLMRAKILAQTPQDRLSVLIEIFQPGFAGMPIMQTIHFSFATTPSIELWQLNL